MASKEPIVTVTINLVHQHLRNLVSLLRELLATRNINEATIIYCTLLCHPSSVPELIWKVCWLVLSQAIFSSAPAQFGVEIITHHIGAVFEQGVMFFQQLLSFRNRQVRLHCTLPRVPC